MNKTLKCIITIIVGLVLLWVLFFPNSIYDGFQLQNRTPIRNYYNNNTETQYSDTTGAATPSLVNDDNYNHMQQTTTVLQNGATYTGENGGKAVVKTNSDGTQSLDVTLNNGKVITMNTRPSERIDTLRKEGYGNFTGNNGSATVFYGPDGEKATIFKSNNGQFALRIQTSEGTYIYSPNNTFYNDKDYSNTEYYGSTGNNMKTFQGYDLGEINTATGSRGNTVVHAEDPYGDSRTRVVNTSGEYYYGPNDSNDSNDSDYSSALPSGIPRFMIPQGQEDLYILKSQVVPPVCPICPVAASSIRNEPCPPCKPCGRCPEPSFECKKVPNYNALGNDEVPVAVLNDFSMFGM